MTLPRLTLLICIGLIVVEVMARSLTANQGVDNFNMITAFESDEPWIAAQVLHNLEEHRIDPEWNYTYGYTYQTIGYGLARVLQRSGFPNDIRFVTVLLRLLSLWVSVLALWALYMACRKAGVARELALVSATLLFLLPDIAHWSQMVHPDMTQLLFVILALWSLLPPCTRTSAILGSIFAGLAFGTKYGGVFVLPFTVIPYLLQDLSWPFDKVSFVKRFLRYGLISLLIFTAAFFISNPTVIVHPRTFWGYLGWHWRYASGGDHAGITPFVWLNIWNLEFGFAWMLWLFLGLLLLSLRFTHKIRGRSLTKWLNDKRNAANANVGAYFICSSIYVFFSLKAHEFRYSFHLLPAVLLLASVGWNRYLAGRSLVRSHFVIFLFALLLLPLAGQSQHRISTLAAKYDSPVVHEGEELARLYPPNSRILVDYYVYVLPTFHKMKRVQGISAADISEFRPDVLVFSKKMTGRWIWPQTNSRFSDKRWEVPKVCAQVCKVSGELFRGLGSADSPWQVDFEGQTMVTFKRKVGAP